MSDTRLPLPGEHSSPTGQSVRQPLPPSRLPLPDDLGMGRGVDGASTPPIKSPWAQAAPHPEGIGIAYYLGTPILVTIDYGNGWIEGVFPDRENPGRAHKRQKPFTYTGRGPDAWRGRMWRDQLRFPALLEAAR